jgi:hypothetical protein
VVPVTLGRLAIEEQLADASAVAEAERHALEADEPLVAALVSVAHVGDAAIARALARRLGLAVTSVLEPEPEALREVERETALRYRALPLALELPASGPRLLRVAMADPTDADAIGVLEESTGCRVEPVLAALGAVDDAIERAYRGFVTVVMRREETGVATAAEEPPPARRPFGGDLSVRTPHHDTGQFSTQPFHQLEEEAPIELRLRALLQVLERKGLVSMEEYVDEIRRLLQDSD